MPAENKPRESWFDTRHGRRGKKVENDALILAERRKRIAELYLQGVAQHRIAKACGLDVAVISSDLKAIRQEWIQAALHDFDMAKSEQLAKIDHIEEVCWEAWERSCNDKTTVTRRTSFMKEKKDGKVQRARDKGGKLIPVSLVEETTIAGQSGDPRFLERIAWCIETRLKVMGALKPAGEGRGGVSLTIPWDLLFTPPEGRVDPLEAKRAELGLPTRRAGLRELPSELLPENSRKPPSAPPNAPPTLEDER